MSVIDALPCDQLTDYQAYRQLYGFPQDRMEHTLAIVGSYLGQVLGGKVKPKDLLPDYGDDKPLRGEALKAVARAWARAWKKKGKHESKSRRRVAKANDGHQ